MATPVRLLVVVNDGESTFAFGFKPKGTTPIPDIIVFKEDSFDILREKIFLGTNITPREQHIRSTKKLLLNYEIIIDGSPIHIYSPGSPKNKCSRKFDRRIPLDDRLGGDHEIKINPIMVKDLLDGDKNIIYLYTIGHIIDSEELKEGIRINKTLESLIYQLFVRKFFLIHEQQFNAYLNDDMYGVYDIETPIDDIHAKTSSVSDLLTWAPKRTPKFKRSITSLNIHIKGDIGNTYNLRHIFDNISITDLKDVRYILYSFTFNYQKFVATKKLRTTKDREKLPRVDHGLILVGSYFHIVFYETGDWYIHIDLQQLTLFQGLAITTKTEETQSKSYLFNLAIHVSKPIIRHINTIHDIFGMTFPKLTEKTGQYGTINVDLIWEQALTTSVNTALTIFMGQLVSMGMTRIKNIAVSEYVWHYGLYHDCELTLIRRVTDFKFRLTGIYECELGWMEKIIKFLVSVVKLPKLLTTKTSRKIFILREKDPLLYSGIADNVYSKLCQGEKRQPEIFTKKEFDKLKSKKYIEKYWNFTKQAVAYYRCTKEFPSLSFITGKHIKDWCIPCCKTKPVIEASKRHKQHKKCLKDHIYMEKSDVLEQKRHIKKLISGLDPGRLGAVPTAIAKIINKPESSDDIAYHVFGVPQTLNSISGTGLLYAIATALQVDIHTFVKEIIKYYEKTPVATEFQQIINETSTMISSTADLATDVRQTLIEFMLGRYNIDVVIFTETEFRSKFLGVPRILVVYYNNEYFPIFGVSISDYIKSDTIAQRIYPTLTMLEKYKPKLKVNNLSKLIMVTKQFKYEIVKLYVNLARRCYATLISKDDQFIYVPIVESSVVDTYGTTNKCFERREYNIDPKLTIQFAKYLPGKFTSQIEYNGEIIGFIHNSLYWYHNPIIKKSERILPDVPVLQIRYDFDVINKAIREHVEPSDTINTLAGKEAYRNNIYELIKLELIQTIKTKERQLHDITTFTKKQLSEFIPHIISDRTVLTKNAYLACGVDKSSEHCIRGKLAVPTDYAMYIDILWHELRNPLLDFTKELHELIIDKLRFRTFLGEIITLKEF